MKEKKKVKKKNQPIKKPKVDHIYYVSNEDLKIKKKDGTIIPGGHDVIVLSVNKKRNTVRVKTITSLEHETDKGMRYDVKALNAAKRGQILPIPIKELNSPHYSGIDHRAKTVPISKLNAHYKKYRFPRRYKKLIHRK